MQIIINVSKTHARILASLLVIILLGIAADYASGAAGLTKWHPLSEISADNGVTSIANTINVPSQGNVSITGNLSLKGAGNRIIFPDNSVLSSATGAGGGSGGAGWATSGLNVYNDTPGVNVGIGTASPGQKLQVEGNVQAQRIKFSGVGGDSGVGADYYAIYQESGAWVNPYPDLRIQYHTGIKYDAYQGYGGHQFYTGYDGTGNPSGLQMQITDKVYIAGNVGIGTTAPQRKLDVSGRLLVREGTIPNGWDTADWGAIVSLRRPGAASMASASDANAQLELVSDGPTTSHISFHRPGVYGANFGLDSDNWLSTQGWSAGAGYTNLRAGTIRSMSGGIQFPDGTTQASAGVQYDAQGRIPSGKLGFTQKVYKNNAGNSIFHANDAAAGGGVGLQKTKETKLNKVPDNTLKIYFECSFSFDAGNWAGYAQIYRNGGAVGTVRGCSYSWSGFTETISGWNDGDLLQIYTWMGGSGGNYRSVSARNLRILGTIEEELIQSVQ